MSPLPPEWIDRLFARLLVRYGAAWLRMWEGIDMGAVKADWAEELAGLANQPEALKYGLDNLPPDRPPTVQQFAAACNRAPVPAPLALPRPEASPVAVQAVKALATEVRSHPRDWADRLRNRELMGDRLTPYQRAAWREARNAPDDPEAA